LLLMHMIVISMLAASTKFRALTTLLIYSISIVVNAPCIMHQYFRDSQYSFKVY